MNKPKTPNRKDAELVEAAKAFAQEFSDSATNQTRATEFAPGSMMSIDTAGVVEITDSVANTMAALRTRAMKILGSKAGHERAMDQMLLKEAHESVLYRKDVNAMATALIDAVFDQGLVTYEFVAPNRLFLFKGGTKSIRIGSVRAMLTEDLQKQRHSSYPNGNVTIIPGDEFSINIHAESTSITLYAVCWVVTVDAIEQNIEEEGKWLIDVAVSLLRLSHADWKGMPPKIGEIADANGMNPSSHASTSAFVSA